MARASSIKTLPQEVLAAVNRLLIDDGWSLDEITKYLHEAGHPRSRSALGRHKVSLDHVAGKLRESREMAEALCQKIGPGATEGKTGRLLIEILQKLVFDHLIDKAGDEDSTTDPMELMRLAKALKDMAGAQKLNADVELKIREDERRKTLSRSADEGEKVMTEAGVSEANIQIFRDKILGIQPDAG